MERIDLLWDAWEDCLCKEELRAEFDRLKAENKAIEESRQAYIKILDETMLENESLQSWLDRISEPIKPHYKFGALSGGLPSNAIQSSIDRLCNYLRNLQEQEVASQKDSSTKSRGAIEASAAEPAYANQRQPNPKPSEKHNPSNEDEGNWIDCPTYNPPKCEHKNGGISFYYSEGVRWQWCDDCKEWLEVPRGLARSQKPLTQCPECIWGQKKVQYERKCLDYPYTQFYFVYEHCPRCKGRGVI